MGNTDQNGQTGIVPVGSEPTLAEVVGNENLPICVNAGIKFKLFAAHFAAAVQKDEKALQVLLAPTDATENNGMTIGEIVGEIRGLMGVKEGEVNTETKDMQTQLESTVGSMAKKDEGQAFDPMAIRVFIRQAFVYYRKETSGKSSLEFAFSLQIDPSKMLKKMEMFELTDVTLSVWKTNRMKVKDRMKMFDIEQYMKEMA